ncbi:KpsF/GutQ family sugar-phosphate isomerase [Taibaiella lutea]|uniref:KpsF/GutQ family sugar-phosphate isomerase n=1 Tax=Taibaiella lutea TaxID=2608001 RepID=A0A5M6CPP8_9BACT|nr:KpsF/GutQ family sugar-phosphate isomerase [Taibaiella lutea]KAA5537134.1 KpsF/GutQ family sugar-phosphate isomerase [Taibaiella lutea]
MLPYSDNIRKYAKDTIQSEIDAMQKMHDFVDEAFVEAVTLMHKAKGRIVITGIGKSAIIAQKIVATMNSTGTPALFMHAADAIHGDLGMIQPDDVVILISKSGESPEIKALLPFIKNFGNKVIAICGNSHSYLALNADHFINTTVDSEACPNNLAPTTSTTAQLVMGDALAVSLLQLKGFTDRDFARFHPGGNLGKRLYLKVQDLSSKNAQPQVTTTASLREIIIEISGKYLGATAVLEYGKLYGIITDGDLRRMLETNSNPSSLKAKDICSKNPKSIEATELAVQALELMRENDITQLIVTENNSYAGMIHLHDLVREGLI